MSTTIAKPNTVGEMKSLMIDFWLPYVQKHFPWATDKDFSAKWTDDFEFTPGEKTKVIKLVEYEKSRHKGVFVELIQKDWDTGGYNFMMAPRRVLYHVKFDPAFVGSKFHVTAHTSKTTGATEAAHVITIEDLHAVSDQPDTLLRADLSFPANVGTINGGVSSFNGSKPATATSSVATHSGNRFSAVNGMAAFEASTPSFKAEDRPMVNPSRETVEEEYTEKQDDHVSKETLRDKHCMMHLVPFSNKQWLNKLILETRQYNKLNP